MKVLTQNYKTGQLALTEVPVPTIKQGHLLVRTIASAVSIGTERAMIEIAKKSLIGKAIARPDWVAQVRSKIKTDGILEAYRQANGRLDIPLPLGYSSSGIVEEVGESAKNFSVGDSVVSIGSGFASHAEYVLMPEHLCLKKPNNVPFNEASFAALGGIALEALRLARPEIGHRVGVIGLGLLGQITVQALKANGCKVLGVDILQDRQDLAKGLGCDVVFDPLTTELSAEAIRFSRGHGLDSVIILASTKSDEPLRQAASMCMERGTIVASGLVGLNVPRDLFFEKELNLVIPKGWGPDIDDSISPSLRKRCFTHQVRWSGSENVRTFLDLLDQGLVNVKALISSQFPFAEADQAYDRMLRGDIGSNVGVVLDYDEKGQAKREVTISVNSRKSQATVTENVRTAIIGAGQYARGTLLPCLSKIRSAHISWIVSERGANAQVMATKYGIDKVSSDYTEALRDEGVDLVILLTRHGQHAPMVCDAMESHKNVFVEKPLATTRLQLDKVIDSYCRAQNLYLIVGYNRRFSPVSKWLKKQFLQISEPLGIHFRVNAGVIPRDSWIYDDKEGCGRVIGEICHFIDLVQFFSNSLITEVFCQSFGAEQYHPTDNVAIFLKTETGSIATINYSSGGDKTYPRERIEIFGGEAVGVLDNFATATFSQFGRIRTTGKSLGIRWGHKELLSESLRSIRDGEEAPVSFVEYVNNSLTTFAIEESRKTNRPVLVDRFQIDPASNQ